MRFEIEPKIGLGDFILGMNVNQVLTLIKRKGYKYNHCQIISGKEKNTPTFLYIPSESISLRFNYYTQNLELIEKKIVTFQSQEQIPSEINKNSEYYYKSKLFYTLNKEAHYHRINYENIAKIFGLSRVPKKLNKNNNIYLEYTGIGFYFTNIVIDMEKSDYLNASTENSSVNTDSLLTKILIFKEDSLYESLNEKTNIFSKRNTLITYDTNKPKSIKIKNENNKIVIKIGDHIEDVLRELKHPNYIHYTRGQDENYNSQDNGNVLYNQTSDKIYYLNYFQYGFDIMITNDKVNRIILHTNQVDDSKFGIYDRCNFKLKLKNDYLKTLIENKDKTKHDINLNNPEKINKNETNQSNNNVNHKKEKAENNPRKNSSNEKSENPKMKEKKIEKKNVDEDKEKKELNKEENYQDNKRKEIEENKNTNKDENIKQLKDINQDNINKEESNKDKKQHNVNVKEENKNSEQDDKDIKKEIKDENKDKDKNDIDNKEKEKKEEKEEKEEKENEEEKEKEEKKEDKDKDKNKENNEIKKEYENEDDKKEKEKEKEKEINQEKNNEKDNEKKEDKANEEETNKSSNINENNDNNDNNKNSNNNRNNRKRRKKHGNPPKRKQHIDSQDNEENKEEKEESEESEEYKVEKNKKEKKEDYIAIYPWTDFKAELLEKIEYDKNLRHQKWDEGTSKIINCYFFKGLLFEIVDKTTIGTVIIY